MGVREMARHSWMVGRRLPKRKERYESPGKEEEKDMRISLPHDGVLHNRSREYFDGKENRRPTNSMQKLKLCLPKKGSQSVIAREPLADKTLNSQNKQNVETDNK
jgi:hypothetical protein